MQALRVCRRGTIPWRIHQIPNPYARKRGRLVHVVPDLGVGIIL
jgi:hypothetical protein